MSDDNKKKDRVQITTSALMTKRQEEEVLKQLEERTRHLVVKASVEAWRPLSGVVFREESDFEAKLAPNHQKTQHFGNFQKFHFLNFPKFLNFRM